MGLIGREIVFLLDDTAVTATNATTTTTTANTAAVGNSRELSLSSGPWYVWPFYGTFMTAACAMGYMSFKRPACDIFIAGITQVSEIPGSHDGDCLCGLLYLYYVVASFCGNLEPTYTHSL